MRLLSGILDWTASVAHAQQEGLNTVGEAAGLSQADLLTIIGNIINVFLGLLGVVFLILTIYAGFLWMTSAGNEELVGKAKNILKSAIIGLIICLAAYAITTFIINALTSAIGLGPAGEETGPQTELFSDSLGSGAIEDHYPPRNATDIARNTRILVTFKNAIYIPSFITGYDVGADAVDVSDDTAPSPAYVNATSFELTCVDQDSVETTYGSTDITVSFTEDLKTFVFDPPVMGSAVAPTDCTVTIADSISRADGSSPLTENYEWSFEVSTEIDSTPPTVESVVPSNGDSGWGRNITIQATFSEGVDPTTSTGSYVEGTGGFTKIQTLSDDDEDGTYSPVAGAYATSSGYTIVEFTPTEECGENSCGDTIYCLPGPDATESAAGTEEEVRIEILAADVSESAAPEATTPYTGIVDLAGNALDGNDDGTAGDDYTDHEFTITDEVVLVPPEVTQITPTVLQEEVTTDQDVVILFDTLMRASTLTNSVVSILANPDHDMWYSSTIDSLDADGVDTSVSGGSPATTQLSINHGTFLESIEDDPSTVNDESTSQLYAPVLPDDMQSLYQNCFYPASGPGVTDTDTCTGSANEPNCCNGSTSIGGFDSATFRCEL